MKTRTLVKLVAVTFCIAHVISSEAATPRHLIVAWPPGWEYQPVTTKRAVSYLQARQRQGDTVVQQLQLEIFERTSSGNELNPMLLHSLIEQLAVAAAHPSGIDSVRALPDSTGYYFVRQNVDPAQRLRHVVEGALLRRSHFIHFRLFTNDAESEQSNRLLAAVERADIKRR